MTIRSTAAVAVRTLVIITAFSLNISAAPASVDDDSQFTSILVKRKPTLKDSDQLSLNNKVPVDALILVGGGLLVALLCFCVAIFNVKAPNASGTRRVREERAQAKTELRLKGGGGSSNGSASPIRNMMMEKKRHHQSNATTATDLLSVESHSKFMSNMPSPGRAGPKIASDFPHNSRASRGYSSYSKSDIAKMGSQSNSLSMLAVPTLMANAANAAADNASLPGSSAGSSGGSNSHYNHQQQSSQWHSNNNRPSTLHDRSNSYQNRRLSNTLGRGVDLNVNRAKSYKSRKNIHVNPQAVVPSYSRRGSTQPPHSSASHGTSHDMQDPLTGYDVKRFSENNSNRDGLPKNTSINALDFFGYGSNGNPIYSNRAYNDSGSDSMSHEAAALDGPSTPSALPRTKQMYFYESEQDGQHSPGLHQDSALLSYSHQSRYASPTKADRRVWDNSNNNYNKF